MNNNVPTAVQAFVWHILTLLSVDETLLPRYADLSTNFREPSFAVKILFTNPSARAGYGTRSIFKWSLTGLNSEFSFS